MSLIPLLLACMGPAEDSGTLDSEPAVIDSDSPVDSPSDSDEPVIDEDGDGYSVEVDCNDQDAEVHPDADEVCNGVDDNCDDVVDTDAIDRGTWYGDQDADGYGAPDQAVTACDQPSDSVDLATDCDDDDASRYPGATEVCGDGVVQDCDGSAEDALAACYDWSGELSIDDDLTTLTSGEGYSDSLDAGADLDGDGIGDLAMSQVSDWGETEDDVQTGIHLFLGPLDEDATTQDIELGVGTAWEVYVLTGDVNGDGSDDVIGAYPESGYGQLAVWHGPITADRTLDEADMEMTGGDSDSGLATNFDLGGDLAGSGVTTLVTTDSNAYAGMGQVLVLDAAGSGSATRDDRVLASVTGGDTSSRLGLGALGDTDLDGDGLVDLVTTSGAYNSGGDLGFFQGPVTGALELGDATWLSETGLGGLGMSLDAGDIDGDGYADLALGAIQQSGNGEDRAGAVLVLAGPLTSAVDPVDDAIAAIEGQERNGYLGGHVSVRDADGDGAAELLVARSFSVRYNNGGAGGGSGNAMYLFRGPVSGALSTADADVDFGAQPHYQTRSILTSDVTGDSLGDLVFPDDVAYVLPWPGY